MSFPLSKSKIIEAEPLCIRASGENITEIDIVKPSLTCSLKMYVSNNSIKTIENIIQFHSLEILLMTNNLISYIEDLQPLKYLERLRIINLEGNPVCHLPLYKVHLLVLRPTLQEIDGKKVDSLVYRKKYSQKDLESIVTTESSLLHSILSSEIVNENLSKNPPRKVNSVQLVIENRFPENSIKHQLNKIRIQYCDMPIKKYLNNLRDLLKQSHQNIISLAENNHLISPEFVESHKSKLNQMAEIDNLEKLTRDSNEIEEIAAKIIEDPSLPPPESPSKSPSKASSKSSPKSRSKNSSLSPNSKSPKRKNSKNEQTESSSGLLSDGEYDRSSPKGNRRSNISSNSPLLNSKGVYSPSKSSSSQKSKNRKNKNKLDLNENEPDKAVQKDENEINDEFLDKEKNDDNLEKEIKFEEEEESNQNKNDFEIFKEEEENDDEKKGGKDVLAEIELEIGEEEDENLLEFNDANNENRTVEFQLFNSEQEREYSAANSPKHTDDFIEKDDEFPDEYSSNEKISIKNSNITLSKEKKEEETDELFNAKIELYEEEETDELLNENIKQSFGEEEETIEFNKENDIIDFNEEETDELFNENIKTSFSEEEETIELNKENDIIDFNEEEMDEPSNENADDNFSEEEIDDSNNANDNINFNEDETKDNQNHSNTGSLGEKADTKNEFNLSNKLKVNNEVENNNEVQISNELDLNINELNSNDDKYNNKDNFHDPEAKLDSDGEHFSPNKENFNQRDEQEDDKDANNYSSKGENNLTSPNTAEKDFNSFQDSTENNNEAASDTNQTHQSSEDKIASQKESEMNKNNQNQNKLENSSNEQQNQHNAQEKNLTSQIQNRAINDISQEEENTEELNNKTEEEDTNELKGKTEEEDANEPNYKTEEGDTIDHQLNQSAENHNNDYLHKDETNDEKNIIQDSNFFHVQQRTTSNSSCEELNHESLNFSDIEIQSPKSCQTKSKEDLFDEEESSEKMTPNGKFESRTMEMPLYTYTKLSKFFTIWKKKFSHSDSEHSLSQAPSSMKMLEGELNSLPDQIERQSQIEMDKNNTVKIQLATERRNLLRKIENQKEILNKSTERYNQMTKELQQKTKFLSTLE